MSDAVYLDQIQKLIELQKVDDKIFSVKQKLDNAPMELEHSQNSFNEINQQREKILDKLSHLQEQKKRLSLEIDDDTAKIKKSKNKLMQVENTREYHAMMREMDSMEKINRNREEEKITLLEELQRQNDALEAIDDKFNKSREEFEEKQAQLDDIMQSARKELDELAEKRMQVGRKIPKPVFMRYEFIRNRLEHPVIVSVRGGICSGCNISIPPQSFIELQKGQQILSCPNCQRLIFWNEDFGTPQENRHSQDSQQISE